MCNGTGSSTNVDTSRLDDDAPEEEDDGQRRRKRPKRVPVKQNLDQSGVYQVHPLKIILHIYDDEASGPKPAKLITLKFEYLLKLNVVCVGIEGSHDAAESNILCNLFPDDTGLDLPHQVVTSPLLVFLAVFCYPRAHFIPFVLSILLSVHIILILCFVLSDTVSQAHCW